MIRISSGDLIQISANSRFYYALVIDKISLFGGQLCFVFYQSSQTPLSASEVLCDPLAGFYHIVDFIWAKRENRAERIAKKIDVDKLNSAVTHFRSTNHWEDGKPKLWFIVERSSEKVVKRTWELTKEEIGFPVRDRIDDILMVDLVDKRWSLRDEYTD